MEILSDATFRGATTFKKDVTISGGDFFITRDDNTSLFYVVRDKSESDTRSEIVHIDGGAHIDSACIAHDATINGMSYLFGGAQIRDSLDLLNFRTIKANGKSITFPSQAGTLALTSQIPSVPSVAGFLKYKKIPINFDVPADCTAFNISENSGNYISDYQVISIGLFKTESHYNDFAFAIKQVQADIFVTCNSKIIVEKSSAFAIGASDGYEIRAAYYE